MSPDVGIYKGATTAAIASASCHRLIAELDAIKQTQFQAKARIGDTDGAKKAFQEWEPKYEAAFTACKSAGVLAKSALAIAPLVTRGTSQDKANAAGWIADLVGAVVRITAALADVGLKLDGVK